MTVINREGAQPQSRPGGSVNSQDKTHETDENAISSGIAVPVHRESRRGSHHGGSTIGDEELGGNSAFFGAVGRQRSIDDIMSRAARQMSEQASQSAAAWRNTEQQHRVGAHARTLSGDGVELPPDVPRVQLRRKGSGILRRKEEGSLEEVRKGAGSADGRERGEKGEENERIAESQEFFRAHLEVHWMFGRSSGRAYD